MSSFGSLSHLVRLSAVIVFVAGSSTALGAITHTTIAQIGGSVPGGGTFTGFSSAPVVNPSGKVAVFATSSGGPSDMIFAGNGTSASIVAGTGQSTPVGGTYGAGGVFSPSVTDTGDVFFGAAITGGSTTGAIIKNSGGSSSAVLLRGSATPIGGTFGGLSSTRANNGGQVAFNASVTGGSANSGLFRTNGTTTIAIAAPGQATPDGSTYTSLSGTPEINNSGKVTYLASTAAGGGIYVSDGAITQAVAVNAAATPLGGTFSGFTNPTINDAGRIAFNTGITGGSVSSASFIFDGTTLTKLAAVGDAVPGLPGVTFASLSAPKINNSGLAVFRATLAGPGVDTTNDSVYVLGSNLADLAVLVREGDSITIGGTPQTLTGNLPATFFSVSDNGFAWRPAYASGSAVVYSADPRFNIPAPGAAGLLALGVLIARRRRN